MGYKVIQIDQSKGYTFLIGTKSKPTNRDRERIARALAGVWEELFAGVKPVPPYGLELVPGSYIPEGTPALPMLERGKTYIIFVLAESETTVSEEEEITTAKGVLQAIGRGFGDSPNRPSVGVIALYNCSVMVQESDSYRTGIFI